jgi:capsule polysaccharide export protein KpsE/RkpR
LAALGDEWLAAAKAWDQFKLEKKKLTHQIRQSGADSMAAARERMGVTQEDLVRDLRARRESLRAEMQQARKRLKAGREEFFNALWELKQANVAVA